jgi:hypothetical protein
MQSYQKNPRKLASRILIKILTIKVMIDVK